MGYFGSSVGFVVGSGVVTRGYVSRNKIVCRVGRDQKSTERRAERFGAGLFAAGAIAFSMLHVDEVKAQLNEVPSRFTQMDSSASDVMFPVMWEGYRSVSSKVGTVILFHNGTREAVDVNWINYSGREINYAIVPPGETFLQPTFATHPWTIREHGSQNTLALTVAREDATILDIEGDGGKASAPTTEANALLLQYVEQNLD